MGVRQILGIILVLFICGCTAQKIKPRVEDVNPANPIINNTANETKKPTIITPKPSEVRTPEDNLTMHYVVIKDLRLNPQKLTIKRGETVTWKHEDKWESDKSTKHMLYAHSNEFRSEVLYEGDMFNHTFNKAGTFTYDDVFYKDREGMRGTITVK